MTRHWLSPQEMEVFRLLWREGYLCRRQGTKRGGYYFVIHPRPDNLEVIMLALADTTSDYSAKRLEDGIRYYPAILVNLLSQDPRRVLRRIKFVFTGVLDRDP